MGVFITEHIIHDFLYITYLTLKSRNWPSYQKDLNYNSALQASSKSELVSVTRIWSYNAKNSSEFVVALNQLFGLFAHIHVREMC